MRIQGLARCTAFNPPREQLISNKVLGPDKGWTLLSPDDLRGFCAGDGEQLVHRGRAEYQHVCASYGEWAFDAQDSSYIRCVVFLHYRTPKKAASLLGDVDSGAKTKIFKFSGADLWATYRRVSYREAGEAHVWQRDTHGEIAIDFCMTDAKELTPNPGGRLVLPTFIPK